MNLTTETERQIGEFREHLLELGRAPNTVKGYLSDLRSFATFLGTPPWPAPDDLDARVKLWLTSRRKKGASTLSMRRYVFAIKAYYGFAGVGHALSRITAPKSQFYAPKLLAKADVEYLLAEIEADDPEAHDFYRLILLAGFRFNELYDVGPVLAEAFGAQAVTVTDESRKERVVDVGSQAAAIFQRVGARGGWTHTKSWLRRTLDKTAKKLNIKHVTCHTLRATCAARMLAAGYDAAFVKQNLGYRSDLTIRLIKRAAKAAPADTIL